jgi:hypothetical protein
MPGFPLRCSSTNSAATAFVVLDHSHWPTHKKNNQLPKSKKKVAKRTAEVWRRPPVDHSNMATAMATGMAMAAAATKAMAESNCCNCCNCIVDYGGKGKGKGRGGSNGWGEGSGIGNKSTEGNVGGDCRVVANGGGNCCCEGIDVGNNGGGGNNNSCSDIGSGCGDGQGRDKGRTMAVMLSAVSGSGNGMTMEVCNAILPRYADAINVGSNNDGNCAPAIDGGNIDGWVAVFKNGLQHLWGGQQ